LIVIYISNIHISMIHECARAKVWKIIMCEDIRKDR